VTTTRTEKIRGTIHRYMPDRRSQWRWLYPLQRICEKAARAMVTGVDRLLGWFPHNHREWIEFIIVALLLWLLMVVAISELDLNSIIPI
jgi:hypothetical protein